MSIYLASKEVWRNRGRFFLFSMVIALITTLVLFIAALSEGLALANREYLEKLDAELLVFQKDVDLSASASRIELSRLNDIRRLEGVEKVGPIGFGTAKLVYPDGSEALDVSIIGVEAGQPGAPQVLAGRSFTGDRGAQAILDANVTKRIPLQVGDQITLKTLQGTEEQLYNLTVVGLTDGQQYLYAPSIFIPYRTWQQIRPQAGEGSPLVDEASNVAAVKIKPGQDEAVIQQQILASVRDVEVADIRTAYESIPGYSVQQSTLNTQRAFTLLIGILVIGGFFQIQMLQKIPQIGVLKAIGASNFTVGTAVVMQIILVTTFGVFMGTLVTLGLAAGIPDSVPVIFNGSSVLIAILTLLMIGPIGGLVTVRLAVRVEPLIALGLSS